MSILEQDFDTRLAAAQTFEERAADFLTKRGYGIKRNATCRCKTCPTCLEDRAGIDFWITSIPTAPDGSTPLSQSLSVQYKHRLPGYSDWQYCLWQPWHGLDDPKTKPGRDTKHTDLWIVDFPSVMQLCDTSKVEALVKGYEQIFRDAGGKFMNGRFHFDDGSFFHRMNDHRTHVPKVLVYFDPKLLGSITEILY